MGFVFSGKTNTHILTRYRDESEIQWEVLAEIPFNSDRKRMSLIVKDQQGRILLMTKGADSIMAPLIGSPGASFNMEGMQK